MRLKPHRLALALSALLAFPALAGEAEKTPAGKTASPEAESAMKIHVDPATGQLLPRPAPGTKAALAPAPAAELPPLKVEKGTTKAGGKRVRLDDRFMMEMTVSVGPDGKVSQTCVAEQEKAPATAAKEHRHDR
jgi:hypothetical protein